MHSECFVYVFFRVACSRLCVSFSFSPVSATWLPLFSFSNCSLCVIRIVHEQKYLHTSCASSYTCVWMALASGSWFSPVLFRVHKFFPVIYIHTHSVWWCEAHRRHMNATRYFSEQNYCFTVWRWWWWWW